jgi:recombinational DNA repair ATPase RecF
MEITKIGKVGKIDYLGKEIEFKDGLNIIIGNNGCGKSTLVNYLKDYQNHFAKGERILFEIDQILGKSTLLIDDLGCLDREKLKLALTKLKDSGRQVIVTLQTVELPEVSDANMIRMEIE